MESFGLIIGHLVGDYILQDDYLANRKKECSLSCVEHCAAYTVAVWLFSFWWLPLWAQPVIFVSHFLIDRYRAVSKAMDLLGQSGFREHLGPWSVIVVDNTWHLLVLFLVQALTAVTGSAFLSPSLVMVAAPLLLTAIALLAALGARPVQDVLLAAVQVGEAPWRRGGASAPLARRPPPAALRRPLRRPRYRHGRCGL